jgi:hypothetical protein
MREYGPGHPLVFSHIPKTAGTSLRAALEQSLRPTVFVQGLDTSLFGGYDDIDDIRPAMRATVYRSPEELPADATLVAGHISPWTTMQRYPGADHVTILRAPQVRVLSQWLHSRAVTELQIRHWGSAAEAFRVGWRPLAEYLEHRMIAPNADNTITRFLAWPHPLLSKTEHIDERHDDELFGSALDRLDAMGHVGLVENPRFMADLAAWLGRDLPDTRLNERTSVPPRMRPDLRAELDGVRDRLDHLVRIDVRVWEHVAGRTLPDADLPSTLEASVQRSVARYGEMLQEPDDTPTTRRAIERLYEVGVRLDPRRRSPLRR